MSGDEIQAIFCDPAQITEYFNLHTAISPEDLSIALCDINGTMFLDEFMETFSINKLLEQIKGDHGK